jgi:lysophospholipase
MSISLEKAEFIRIDQQEVPAGADAYWLPTPDNDRLRIATFAVDAAVGTVILTTGRCEFIEKYFEVVEELRARKLNVVMMDWRGQGLSSRLLAQPEKGHIKTFGTYVADFRLLMRDVVKPAFAPPYFALTHSMGSAPILNLLADGYDELAGAVLVSPMTRLFDTPLVRLGAKLLAHGGVRVGAGRRSVANVREASMAFEGNNLTSDRQRHARFRLLQEAAPNASVHAPTYGWLKAAFDAMDRINAPASLAGMKVPVLIIAAGDDTVVDGSNAPRLAGLYEKLDCKVIEGAQHEVLMEQDQYRAQFWTHFDTYMAARLKDYSAAPASNGSA